jgi:group I intron endonuclease
MSGYDDVFVIYKHTTPDGRVYIGATSRKKPEYRWGRRGNGYKGCSAFWDAIQEVGWESIKHEILEINVPAAEVESREAHFIAEHNATDPKHGYNRIAHTTVYKRGTLTESHRRKLCENHKGTSGITYTSEQRERISTALKGKPRTWKRPKEEITQIWRAAATGRRHTEDAKRRMSEIQKALGIRSKAVQKFTLSGSFIREYPSIRAAAEDTGCSAKAISEQLRKGREISGGYAWRFVDG